jgi:prevent-host-death family protein
MTTYSIYEAKARFSEVIRVVRRGGTVIVTYRGDPVAEIRPIESDKQPLERRLAELEREGALQGRGSREGRLDVIERRPGALRRFLNERES